MKKAILPIIILSLLFGGVALAQEAELPDPSLTPDSPFYFLDTLGEKIGMFFTFGAEKKAEKAFQYAGEKLAEVKVMAGANKIEALKKAGQKYQEYLALFFKKGGEAYEEGKDVTELEERSKQRSLDYLRVLSDAHEEALEEAKAEVEKIIKVSRESFGETIWSVHEEQMKEVREEKIEEEKEALKEMEAPIKEEIPQEEIVPEEIKKAPEIKEKPKEKPAKIAPYCGNNICDYPENRETCVSDCMYTPMEDEDVISEDNVIIIYNKKFDKEWEKLQLKDDLNCISVLRDKFKIDLSEPAKTKLLILDKLVGSGERVYSSASPFGITNFRDSAPANMDYFRKKIEEENVCLNFHEMTHVFVSKTPIPWWANEGLATYAEREFDPSREKIECRENRWYGSGYYGGTIEQPYSDLSKPPGQNGEPNIYWYYTGYCFWDFIQKKYGDSAMIEILQELKKNENNHPLDFLKDIVNKVLNEDITGITKEKFGVPSE